MKRILPLLLLLAGCDSLPRDPDGSLERIRGEGRFRVGLIARDAAELRGEERLLAALQDATGARAQVQAGAAEPLLAKLEGGELDLVVGPMLEDTPWRPRVAMVGPLYEVQGQNGAPRQIWAAARNGENRWISTVEHVARGTGATLR